MVTMFRNEIAENTNQVSSFFDVNAELRAHAWRPQMTAVKAEAILSGKPSYTYITHPRENERGFAISFVNLNGEIEHHPFSLIDQVNGIWRNGQVHHVGKLAKVICDMMDCELFDCRPLLRA